MVSQEAAKLSNKKKKDMTKIMIEAGSPQRAIALIPEALKLCAECRRFEQTGTTPALSLNLTYVFNHSVYFDLVFVDDWNVHIICIVFPDVSWWMGECKVCCVRRQRGPMLKSLS